MPTSPLIPPVPVPIVQPASGISWTEQITSAAWVEEKNSRASHKTLTSDTIVYRFLVAGTPDQVRNDPNMGGLKMGFPHQTLKFFYITDITFVHHTYGVEPNDTTSARPTPARTNVPSTLVTITYKKVPPPGLWESESDTVLITRLEWYDRSGFSLMNTREGIPLLIPQTVYKRIYRLTFLNTATRENIENLNGKRNGQAWRGKDPGVWLMEKARCRLLWGNERDDDQCAYEVILQARADPVRKHEWWFPMTDASGVPISSYDPAHPELAFTRRTLYELDDRSWDDVVPLLGTPLVGSDWEDEP